jgi:hypothetical protein
MKLTDLAFACLILSIGIFIGHFAADLQTIKDCERRRVSDMLGGGSITCTVNEDTP